MPEKDVTIFRLVILWIGPPVHCCRALDYLELRQLPFGVCIECFYRTLFAVRISYCNSFLTIYCVNIFVDSRYRPSKQEKIGMARSVVDTFPVMKCSEGSGYVSGQFILDVVFYVG
jgi:hypothetical protein